MTETGAGAVVIANREPRHVGTRCFGRADPPCSGASSTRTATTCRPASPASCWCARPGADPRRGFFRDYLKDAAATAEAWGGGWFHTGDVVRADADGQLYFVDRRKNVIRRSGENIAAVEVEACSPSTRAWPRSRWRRRPTRSAATRCWPASCVASAARRDWRLAAELARSPRAPRLLQGAGLGRVRRCAAAHADAEGPARRAEGAGRDAARQPNASTPAR